MMDKSVWTSPLFSERFEIANEKLHNCPESLSDLDIETLDKYYGNARQAREKRDAARAKVAARAKAIRAAAAPNFRAVELLLSKMMSLTCTDDEFARVVEQTCRTPMEMMQAYTFRHMNLHNHERDTRIAAGHAELRRDTNWAFKEAFQASARMDTFANAMREETFEKAARIVREEGDGRTRADMQPRTTARALQPAPLAGDLGALTDLQQKAIDPHEPPTRHLGPWDSGIHYWAGDAVERNGYTFRCISVNRGPTTSDPSVDPLRWRLEMNK